MEAVVEEAEDSMAEDSTEVEGSVVEDSTLGVSMAVLQLPEHTHPGDIMVDIMGAMLPPEDIMEGTGAIEDGMEAIGADITEGSTAEVFTRTGDYGDGVFGDGLFWDGHT